MTSEQIRAAAAAAAEEVIRHLKGSEYLCACGTCKRNSNKRVQEISAIISKHLNAPEQASCPHLHQEFATGNINKCGDCGTLILTYTSGDVRERSPRVCVKCGWYNDGIINCNCNEFPASVAAGGVEAMRERIIKAIEDSQSAYGGSKNIDYDYGLSDGMDRAITAVRALTPATGEEKLNDDDD